MTAMVTTTNLTKTFKRADGSPVHAVKGVNLQIETGEIFSLLGPNGAGKTTTISMISGLIAPTEGDATIGGHSITREPMAAKRLMGVIPQEIALYTELSARQNLEFFGKMYGMSGKELIGRVDEVLDFVDLTDRQNDRVDTFSGGMKRRVNIAVGLLHRPKLVYMDEPTVGIDPQNRRRVLDTVVRLRDEYDMTVLYTTHLMEEAQELSDRVGIIDHGEVIALGTQGQLTEQVGEEDRLVFTVGSQKVEDSVMRQIEQNIGTVSRALYDAPQETESGVKDAVLTVFAQRGREAMPQIVGLLNDVGVTISAVEVREPDLEAVFLQLTGRALRD